jgi:Uma2 family endonuclease
MSITEQDRLYTVADYMSWDDDKRYELIKGVVYEMTPSPSFDHQDIVTHLAYLLKLKLINNRLRVIVAPFDVKYKDNTVVQPDVVVLEKGKLIPAAVIEVMSPSSAKHDMVTKLLLYNEMGIEDYYVVDIKNRLLYRSVNGELSEREIIDIGGALIHVIELFGYLDE